MRDEGLRMKDEGLEWLVSNKKTSSLILNPSSLINGGVRPGHGRGRVKARKDQRREWLPRGR